MDAFLYGRCGWHGRWGVGGTCEVCQWTWCLKNTASRRPLPGHRSTPPLCPTPPAGGAAVVPGSGHHCCPFDLGSARPPCPRSSQVCRTCFSWSGSTSVARGTTPRACPVVAPCAKRGVDLGVCACRIIFGVGASYHARRTHHCRNFFTLWLF